MSQFARHGLGVLAGVVLTPLIAIGLMYGTGEFYFAWQQFTSPSLGLALLVPTGLLIGVMVGSRLSPLASMIGGLLFIALGVMTPLAFAAPHLFSPDIGVDLLPEPLVPGYRYLQGTGGFVILGTILLAASLFPARWRAASVPVGPAVPAGPPPAGPYPQPQHGHAAPSPFSPRHARPVPPDAPGPYQPGPYQPRPFDQPGDPGQTEITRPLPPDERR